jgi:hypothetical protein
MGNAQIRVKQKITLANGKRSVLYMYEGFRIQAFLHDKFKGFYNLNLKSAFFRKLQAW